VKLGGGNDGCLLIGLKVSLRTLIGSGPSIQVARMVALKFNIVVSSAGWQPDFSIIRFEFDTAQITDSGPAHDTKPISAHLDHEADTSVDCKEKSKDRQAITCLPPALPMSIAMTQQKAQFVRCLMHLYVST
jgi:hypothetical protein